MALTRRTFLASSALAASLTPLGCAAAAPVRRPRAPDQKLRLMVIGVANRGAANLAGVATEDIRVLCDVDRTQLQAAAQKFPAARTCEDYRTVLADAAACAELDGVVISTPDHSHFLPALLALRAGLDVYCEKPLTLTVGQARQLRELAAANGCITQMGTQIHANENYHRVVEAVRAGAVGPVREVVVFVNGTDWSATELPEVIEPPAHLAWDLWLGAAPEQPCRKGFHPAGWRRYWAFGGGTTADMACHFVDLAFWALQLDAPTSLRADGTDLHPDCAPAGLRCAYRFAARGDRPALTLHWHGGKDRPEAALAERGLEQWRNGVLFVGDDGWLISDYNRHEIGPAARREAFVPPAPWLAPTPSHHQEWIAACKAGTEPSCSFAYSGLLSEAVLLANAAFRGARGEELAWNAARMATGNPAVDALLHHQARAGWAG
ncbi:MAG: Gfo/Idh/MocA family oxidoreductase [Planctomycetes bacterium]|nr:Gfo/Idh/MocA family oxidoreductase [Planctomycetota bacterium]